MGLSGCLADVATSLSGGTSSLVLHGPTQLLPRVLCMELGPHT